MTAILFVCLGNICRSPMAQGALRARAGQAGLGWRIDSAGTGDWHAGDPPDPRAVAEAARHGVDISDLRARQVTADDFRAFDHIIAMDHDNLANLRAITPAGAHARLSLMRDHAGDAGQAVADPYFGGPAGFARTWAQVDAGARGLIAAFT